MTARYPLVLNGTTIEEVQSADTLTGLTSGNSILAGDSSGGIKNISLAGNLSFDGSILTGTPTSLPATATVAEMQAGTQTALRSMSPSLVASAIGALAQGKFIKSVSNVGPGAYTINVYNGWNSTGFGATITPSSASSKIVVLAVSTGSNMNNTSSGFAIARNGTIVSGDLPSYGSVSLQPNVVFIDSPATTSACTYTFYYRYSGGGYITGGALYNPSIVLLEVQA